jgi:ubiquinone biosynthesis protein
VFLDGAIATPAPDLDLLGEIQQIVLYFAATHGERIAQEVGMDPNAYRLDMDAVKGNFGVDPTIETLTYRELQERRALIRERLARRGR